MKPESGYTGSGITSVKILRNSVITDITSDICLRTCTDIGIHWFKSLKIYANTGITSTKRLMIYEAVGITSSKKLMIFTNFDWNSFKKSFTRLSSLNIEMIEGKYGLNAEGSKNVHSGVNVTKHFCP